VTDPDRRRRVEDLCHAALDREVRERAAFVPAACGDDQALRDEVEALLARAQKPEGFLAVPIAEVAAHVLADARGASFVGQQIGAYRILSPDGQRFLMIKEGAQVLTQINVVQHWMSEVNGPGRPGRN
jgi:eukaryotic-like serine/threonine-protein kinase